MKIMRKLHILLLIMLSAITSSAFESAEIRINRPNGKNETKKVEMKEIQPDVFRVMIPVREIPRDCTTIDVVADCAKAKKGEAGFFVTPDGSYMEFTQDKGFFSAKNLMPILGMKTPRGAAVAIVKGLSLEYKPTVEVKNGNYEIFPRFEIKNMEFDPYEDIVIDYYKLRGEDANYSGMARTYRNYQLSRGEVKPLKDRIKGNPTLEYTANSIYVRIKFGWRDRRAAPKEKWADLPIIVLNTFANAKDIMKRIHEAGMKDVEVCFVGWQKGGHDGPYPDLFPINKEFGGEEGMVDAIAYGKSLGFQITSHINHHDTVKSASRYDPKNVMWGLDGKERKYTMLPGGQVYFSCFQVSYDRFLDEDLAKLKEVGFNGTQHVDVTTAILPHPCHNPLHPGNRKIQAEYQRKISQKCIDTFGAYSSEAGFDHIAGVTDYALYVLWSGTENNPLVKRMVPLWQIVYHGIILSAPYYGTIDASYPRENEKLSDSNSSYSYLGSTENRLLKFTEFGGRPAFYYIDYKNLEPMKEMYDEYMKLRHLQFEFMESHSEISPNVFLVKYSDGSEMVCNYNESSFDYMGKSVKPMSYELYKASERADFNLKRK